MGEAPRDRVGKSKRGLLVVPVWAAAASLMAGLSVAGSGCSSGQQSQTEVERLQREVQLLKENQALKERLAIQQGAQKPTFTDPNSTEVERLRLEIQALKEKQGLAEKQALAEKQLQADKLALEERRRALAEREALNKKSEIPPP